MHAYMCTCVTVCRWRPETASEVGFLFPLCGLQALNSDHQAVTIWATHWLVNTLPLIQHHCSLALSGERTSHIWATLWDLGILNIIFYDLQNTCWWHEERQQGRSAALCSSPANHPASFSCWMLSDWGPDLTNWQENKRKCDQSSDSCVFADL